jgi:branched-chain amino acid transport system ATP-binding protein
VFRIVALSVPFTGAGVGLMVPLREGFGNMQFGSRRGFALMVLGLVVLALLVTCWLRHSRFGAYLQAVRDNEDAARAAGVNPFRIKLGAIALSGGFMGAGGAFYVQAFQYIDPGIAYGAHTSVEALVGAIVGGMGTLWGPLIGALALHVLADLTRNLFGQLPGINMVIYGVVLVLMILFAPRGLGGPGAQRARAVEGPPKMSAALMTLTGVSRSFGGLKAVQDVSLAVPQGSLTALIGPNGAGKTTLFALMSGFLIPDSGRIQFDGQDITGRAPDLNARQGLARTFQIVQPFAAQTVRENIAVGAHLHEPRRVAALAAAEAVAQRVGLAAQLDKPAADLTVAGRKRLELARALATQPKLLLLDEVLAGLNPQEIGDMIPVVRGIAQSGVTVLMIEHVMQAVMNLAEHVWVLAQGQLIAQGSPAEVTSDAAVIEAYLGHGTAAKLRRQAAAAAAAGDVA